MPRMSPKRFYVVLAGLVTSLANLGCEAHGTEVGECTGTRSQAIIGGSPDASSVGLDDVSAAVAAIVVESDGAPTSLCSGLLVAPRFVLTAAHCARGAPPEAVQVTFGPNAPQFADHRSMRPTRARAHVLSRRSGTRPQRRFDACGTSVRCLISSGYSDSVDFSDDRPGGRHCWVRPKRTGHRRREALRGDHCGCGRRGCHMLFRTGRRGRPRVRGCVRGRRRRLRPLLRGRAPHHG